MRLPHFILSLKVFFLLMGCGSEGGGTCAAGRGGAVSAAPGTPQKGPDGRCLSFVEGAPVGLACLHCPQPQARAQSELLANLMGASCRRNLATMVLVDGSFGHDPAHFNHLIQVMTRNGSALDLYLYLVNGPWQRSSLPLPGRGFASRMRPEEFRARIQGDEGFREEFRNHVRRLVPMFERTTAAGARLNIIPVLEDNLDAPGARSIEALVRESIPSSIPYRLGRNPCSDCYLGNDASAPEGLFADQHLHSNCDTVRVSNGLVSNDGSTFTFPGEVFNAPFDLDDGFRFAFEAAQQSNSYVLWNAEFQGVAPDGVFTDPASRNYLVPTEAQQVLLTEFLRATY